MLNLKFLDGATIAMHQGIAAGTRVQNEYSLAQQHTSGEYFTSEKDMALKETPMHNRAEKGDWLEEVVWNNETQSATGGISEGAAQGDTQAECSVTTETRLSFPLEQSLGSLTLETPNLEQTEGETSHFSNTSGLFTLADACDIVHGSREAQAATSAYAILIHEQLRISQVEATTAWQAVTQAEQRYLTSLTIVERKRQRARKALKAANMKVVKGKVLAEKRARAEMQRFASNAKTWHRTLATELADVEQQLAKQRIVSAAQAEEMAELKAKLIAQEAELQKKEALAQDIQAIKRAEATRTKKLREMEKAHQTEVDQYSRHIRTLELEQIQSRTLLGRQSAEWSVVAHLLRSELRTAEARPDPPPTIKRAQTKQRAPSFRWLASSTASRSVYTLPVRASPARCVHVALDLAEGHSANIGETADSSKIVATRKSAAPSPLRADLAVLRRVAGASANETHSPSKMPAPVPRSFTAPSPHARGRAKPSTPSTDSSTEAAIKILRPMLDDPALGGREGSSVATKARFKARTSRNRDDPSKERVSSTSHSGSTIRLSNTFASEGLWPTTQGAGTNWSLMRNTRENKTGSLRTRALRESQDEKVTKKEPLCSRASNNTSAGNERVMGIGRPTEAWKEHSENVDPQMHIVLDGGTPALHQSRTNETSTKGKPRRVSSFGRNRNNNKVQPVSQMSGSKLNVNGGQHHSRGAFSPSASPCAGSGLMHARGANSPDGRSGMISGVIHATAPSTPVLHRELRLVGGTLAKKSCHQTPSGREIRPISTLSARKTGMIYRF